MNKYIQKNTNTFGKSLQKYSKNNTNKKKRKFGNKSFIKNKFRDIAPRMI